MPESAGLHAGQDGPSLTGEGQGRVVNTRAFSFLSRGHIVISQSGPSRIDSQLPKAIICSLTHCLLPSILPPDFPTLLGASWGYLPNERQILSRNYFLLQGEGLPNCQQALKKSSD